MPKLLWLLHLLRALLLLLLLLQQCCILAMMVLLQLLLELLWVLLLLLLLRKDARAPRCVSRNATASIVSLQAVTRAVLPIL